MLTCVALAIVALVIVPFVIVCSRCPWFRRALTSGMKESIEKKIALHDCNLEVFQYFLQFLYSGLYKIELSLEPPQLLADLFLMADRYEVDDLKTCCEESLTGKVDTNSCFALLALADQFQAAKLRRICFEFIAQRPAVCTEENLEDLPLNQKIPPSGVLVVINCWICQPSLMVIFLAVTPSCCKMHCS